MNTVYETIGAVLLLVGVAGLFIPAVRYEKAKNLSATTMGCDGWLFAIVGFAGITIMLYCHLCSIAAGQPAT